jgi:hypothetical protein
MLTAFFKISLSSVTSFKAFSNAFIFKVDSKLTLLEPMFLSLENSVRHLFIDAKLTEYSVDNSETDLPNSNKETMVFLNSLS